MSRRRKPNNRPNGRGTLFIERTYPMPVGLVRRASGTNDAKAHTDILNMMDNLARSVPPRFDVLLAIKDKSLSPLYALSLWRQGKLEQLPTASTLPMLLPVWEAWAKGRTDISEDYRSKLLLTVKALARHHAQENPTIGDLPMLLESYREECVQERKPTQFNRAKAHVQAFVKAKLRRRNPLYGEVSDIDTLEEAEGVRRPQKPEALAVILQLLPEPHRTMAWELAVTGMRPKEYFGQQWTQHSDPARIEVKKSKTDAGKRDIPLWAGAITGPKRSRDAFEDMWRRRIRGMLDIYDLRRSFAVWMEDAGIPRSRRKLYLGHAAGDTTGLYETRELLAWIAEDAVRLQAYAPEWRDDERTDEDADGDGEGTSSDAATAYAGIAGDKGAVGEARAERAVATQTNPQTKG